MPAPRERLSAGGEPAKGNVLRRITLGTRGSALALRQAALAVAALKARSPGLEVEVTPLRTEGDRRADVSLELIGGEGVFVKDIERALLDGGVDVAVHSLKDMPPALPAGLTIAAVLPRGDVRDALVGHAGAGLGTLPPWATVGTDSRRRVVQLLALRPDLRPQGVRGNVDTRVAKAESGALDAVVLALAGLQRLGLEGRASQVFTPDEMLPAVGQGVLALEARADDTELVGLLRAVDDATARVAITAERAYLRRLGAGCRLPVAAYGEVEGGRLRLRAMLAGDDGRIHRHELAGPASDAEAIGAALAELLAARAGVEATS